MVDRPLETGGGPLPVPDIGQSPVAAHAVIDGNVLTITALAALPDGTEVLREAADGDADDAVAIGAEVAERLRARGVDDLLERAREMTE